MVRNYQAGRTRQGASTLTQQLARNSFPIELPSNDRSYKRKLLEMFVAQEIEKQFSKSKILELYLNRVFFGGGFYGAEAAARGYFAQARQGPESFRSGDARRPAEKPEQSFALEQSAGVHRSAELRPRQDARTKAHLARRNTTRPSPRI